MKLPGPLSVVLFSRAILILQFIFVTNIAVADTAHVSIKDVLRKHAIEEASNFTILLDTVGTCLSVSLHSFRKQTILEVPPASSSYPLAVIKVTEECFVSVASVMQKPL